MSITQILQQAQTLTHSIVKTNSQDYIQASTSMKAPLETNYTNFRSAGFYKNLVDFHYSKIIDFGGANITSTAPVAIELPLAFVPVASNVSIDSISSVDSSIFSQSDNVNNSLEDLAETLSNTTDRTRGNVSRAVRWFLGSLKANKSTIAAFTGPKITNDYSECLMVKEFFGMTKCMNRDTLTEQLVYSNYLFMPFVKLVDSFNDAQAKYIDEPLIYEDYLVPRFFTLPRVKQSLEVENDSHSAALLLLLCHDPVNSALMFTNNALGGFAKGIEEPISELPVFNGYWFIKFMKLVNLNNDVQSKQIDEPLLYEDYLVPRFFSLPRAKQYLELEYNSHSAAMLWLFCHNPINRVLMFQPHILDDFIATVEEPTSELPVFQEYWFVSFISLAESDLIEEVNYDSAMVAEYISMRNNPIPGEIPYEPLVGEISELIESIVSTTAKESFHDYLPAFLALSDAKGQEISQYDSLIQDYFLPQFYKLVTVQSKQLEEPIYDIADFMAATDKMLEEHKRKLADIVVILDKILSFKDPMLELYELTQLKSERQFNEDTILRRRIK